MTSLKIALVAAAAGCGAALTSIPASAMPASGLTAAADEISNGIQNVRWVCPRYHHCFWVGGPRFYRDRDRDDFRFRFRHRDRDRDHDRF